MGPRTWTSDLAPQAQVLRAQFALEMLFQGKWQLQIICALRNGPVRIGYLSRAIPSASKKMLAQSLRRLEANNIVLRRDLSDLVLHVEYELHSDLHQAIFAIVDQLSSFGGSFFEEQDRERKLQDQAVLMESDAD